MRRVSVVGNAGAGKSTLARGLGAALGVPYVELDAIFHQANWTPLPSDEFRARLSDIVAGDGWVIDGNYSTIRDLVLARADTVVWVDPPRHRVMRQVTSRTVLRAVRREPLWNGNREDWRTWFRRDPRENLLLWAWTQHATYRERFAAESADPSLAHIRMIRVASRSDAAALLTAAT